MARELSVVVRRLEAAVATEATTLSACDELLMRLVALEKQAVASMCHACNITWHVPCRMQRATCLATLKSTEPTVCGTLLVAFDQKSPPHDKNCSCHCSQLGSPLPHLHWDSA